MNIERFTKIAQLIADRVWSIGGRPQNFIVETTEDGFYASFYTFYSLEYADGRFSLLWGDIEASSPYPKDLLNRFQYQASIYVP